MLISREEAVNFIHSQFDNLNKNVYAGDKAPWHYGRVELRELLDAIYGDFKEGDTKL